jgi:hypothetical protein
MPAFILITEFIIGLHIIIGEDVFRVNFKMTYVSLILNTTFTRNTLIDTIIVEEKFTKNKKFVFESFNNNKPDGIEGKKTDITVIVGSTGVITVF